MDCKNEKSDRGKSTCAIISYGVSEELAGNVPLEKQNMIADLKPYAEYKATRSRWLATVPSHWEIHNLRTLIRRRNERNRADLPLLSVAREKGVFVRSLSDANENHNVIPEDLSNYKVARAGNLVINKMKAWQGSMGIAPCDGIVSPAYFVFDFHIANYAFGQKLLRSKPYVAHFGQTSDGVRVGQWDLTIAGMRQIPVLVPPPDEQAAIVRFLDYANRWSDRFIKAKKKVIALLNEQKQAIIHRAVTRGLDPNVCLKPSGIPWLGDIPEHWDIAALRSFARKRSERNAPHLSLLSVVREKGVIVRNRNDIEENHNFIPDDLSNYKVVKVGDLAINKMKAWQGSLGVSEHTGIVSPAYYVCKLVGGHHGSFLHSLLRSRRYVEQYLMLSEGIRTGQWDLDFYEFLKLPVLLPPYAEQLKIAEFIKSVLGDIAVAITGTEREIALLREYRTSLIADVVTGKLDVREAAKKLPEETIESGIIDEDEITVVDEEIMESMNGEGVE